MKDSIVEEEKEMWRQIFFSLSAGIALKKTPADISYQRSKSMTDGENPQIDIKRLVNFLHTRDISSKKVRQIIVIYSTSVFFSSNFHYIISHFYVYILICKVRRTNRSTTASTGIYGIFISG